MNSRLALRPDLMECELEDRALLAVPIGLMPSQFIPNGSNNSFVVAGTVAPGSSAAASAPGPSYFYLLLGSNGGTGLVGSRIGGSVSVYGLNSPTNAPISVALVVGSGANAGGSSGSGTLGNFSGYGGNISSGYNFALNITNNYGMSATAIGSVPLHSYDNGPVARSPVNQDTSDKGTNTPGMQSTPAVPLIDTTRSPLVPGINRGNNLLQNNLTGMGLLPMMPKAPGTTP